MAQETTTFPVRRAQKRETRKRILAVAERLVAEFGVAGTTTAAVASAAGVAHGTVFAHFPSRDDLLTAVIDEFTLRIARDIRNLALTHEPSLREVLNAHAQTIRDQEGSYAALHTGRALLPKGSRTRLVILQSAVAFYFHDAANREGLLDRFEAGILFNTWLGLLHHYVFNPDLYAAARPVLAVRGDALVEHYLSLVGRPAND